ncbi:MAG: N-acetylmuramoyl-L-alanine amidase [Lachnospiraceae bacterium]|nr:N-acetylmuramoyl-L-alanine amidase [Lachnospiraceae bacterium]
MRVNLKKMGFALLIWFVAVFLIRQLMLETIGTMFTNVHTEKNAKGVDVVIDPGHGGFDPGKVGIHNELEKDINLAIAKKLKTELNKAGLTSVLTRKDDHALSDANGNSGKSADMRGRVEIINKECPQIAISIHQNSFEGGKAYGAQVFYYMNSPKSMQLATKLQEALRDGIPNGNHREAKGNGDYYILTKTTRPTVIVECGFLSDPDESIWLSQSDYQKRIARCICEGVKNYLESQ